MHGLNQENAVDLTPKCEDCAALCCVMLPFDAGEAFAFDKPAGEPCRHLNGHACSIHATLAEKGFAGCLRYDCHGAGQRVVQEVFAGRSWRQDASLLAPMEAAFRAMRRLHEDHGLLTAATRLPLTEAEETRRQDLLVAVALAAPQTSSSLGAYETGPLPRAVKDFIAALRQRLTPHR
ncbi:MAG: hypothetical protein ACOH2H_14605 [Cypionkella sp.]